MSKKNPPDLGIPAAIWLSLRGKATDFYPRVKDDETPIRTLKTRGIMRELVDAAEQWTSLEPGDKLESAIGLARHSLDEVKAQTEYQDQKAGRLLTVATIFSALAALLFQRFSDAYPLLATWKTDGCEKCLIFFAYLLFLAFALSVLFGALVTFHATRTRFKYDEEDDDKREKAAGDNEPHSRLFYTGMLRARPRAWMSSFVTTHTTGKDTSLVLNPKLAQLYFRDLVGEAYLVAAKTADKIRFLIEAQRLFAWALIFLVAWLLMFFLVSFVPSTKPDPGPTHVRMEPRTGAVPPTVVRIDQQRPLVVDALLKPSPEPGQKAQIKVQRTTP